MTLPTKVNADFEYLVERILETECNEEKKELASQIFQLGKQDDE